MAEINELQNRLGYTFRDTALLELALTHPSVTHEQAASVQTNQRLEFLGDAVLQLVLTHSLYEKFPEFDEGPLTKARAKLVNRRALAEQGRRLDLGSHLILSPGEEKHGGRERASALADCFESLLGAIFLDGGFEAAREFIWRQFVGAFSGLSSIPALENPKGELQELLQSRSAEAPQYHVMSISGPDHDRIFECTVHHGGAELARGTGKSKKAAESEAALAALKILTKSTKPKPVKTLFQLHSKVLIGVVHLKPLPGSPRHRGKMHDTIKFAITDAQAYERGGAHAVIIENFGDVPFTKTNVGPATVAAMAAAGCAIRAAVKLPIGFNVLRNDAEAALGLCAACGGEFIRVNVHCGAMLTDQGMIEGDAFHTLRQKERICPHAQIFADVHVKHAVPLGDWSLEDAANDTIERGLADALIVSGVGTGKVADIGDVKRVRDACPRAKILLGSGVNVANVEDFLRVADGVIVGSSLKKDGKLTNPVDAKRVAALVKKMK